MALLADTALEGPIARTLVACALPVAAAIGGAAWAARRPPAAAVRSAIQHFAAGLVFAIAASELIPDLKEEHRTAAVIGGFTLGVALMLAIQVGAKRLGSGSSSATPVLVVTGIDFAVDGLLLGIAFADGGTVGLLLAFALTVELLGLGVAVALSLIDSGHSRAETVATTSALSIIVVFGGLLGASALSGLGGSALSFVLAFATAALLYLVTEELLTEAHETEDTPLLTATFFAGFLLVLILSFTA
jgi:ZIP family zinc transporter